MLSPADGEQMTSKVAQASRSWTTTPNGRPGAQQTLARSTSRQGLDVKALTGRKECEDQREQLVKAARLLFCNTNAKKQIKIKNGQSKLVESSELPETVLIRRWVKK